MPLILEIALSIALAVPLVGLAVAGFVVWANAESED